MGIVEKNQGTLLKNTTEKFPSFYILQIFNYY
jgi:hypothetical protein